MKQYDVHVTYSIPIEAHNSDQALAEAEKKATDIAIFQYVDSVIPKQKRTSATNNAEHKCFRMISRHCDDLGLTQSAIWKDPGELPVTEENIKKFFSSIAEMMYGIPQTSQLSREQTSNVIKTFLREMSTRADYHEPFPSQLNIR